MYMTNTFLSRLDWRFATKKFDATKKLTSTELNEITRAIRFAPTSYGIQPFHVVVVTDPALRTKLRAVSYDQAQVTDASHLFIFCARTDITSRVDQYVSEVTGGSKEAQAGMKGYIDMMHGALDSQTGTAAWSAKQAYIALGFGLAAAAEIGVDTCPMEGFDAAAVDKVLELPAHLHAIAYMAAGTRGADATQPKFRFAESDLFETR
jgi:nitroreductase